MKIVLIAMLALGVGTSFIVLLMKVLYEAGLPINKQTMQLIRKERNFHPQTVTQKDLCKVFLGSILFRVLVLVASIVAVRLMLESDQTFSLADVSSRWMGWDAKHYLNLAELGYNGYVEDGKHLFLVFFPLYPWLIRAVTVLTRNYISSAFIISYLAYAIGCCFLYSMTANDYGKRVAKKAVIFLSIFPFSFFFGGIMTESLFFLTSVACLYYIRQHKWPLVMVWGILACLTRIQGLALGLAAGVELCIYYQPIKMLREKDWKSFRNLMFTKVPYLLGILLGTVGYLLLNYVTTGNPFEFLIHQKEHWFNTTVPFTTCLSTVYDGIVNGGFDLSAISIWLPEFLMFVMTLLVLLYSMRKHYVTYTTYLWTYLILCYSISWLLSGTRYMSCAVPVFILAAEATEQHDWLDRWYIAVSGMFFGIYLTGYVFMRSIM